MRLPRLHSFRTIFILPILLTTSLTAMSDDVDPKLDISQDDLNTNEFNTNVDEPQIDLPEIYRKANPFRNVSQGVRKESRDPLVKMVQTAVDTTARRMLSTDQHTPWQMMHALLGLRHDFQMLHHGQPVSGLDWISKGQVFDNEYWFEKTNFGGRAHPYNRPYAFEGHANQFVAILSMCGVELDREFGTTDGPVTMRGMIEHAKMSLDLEKDEPTWTLWALSRYLPPDARWRNSKGEIWSIERLVQDQTNRPMKGAPCGGTHSLFALAHARNVYLRQGKPLRGPWMQAEYKIRKYINVARMQQNSNGTLSSNYFRGREYNQDFNKRMASAGHLLEFLMIALPQEELKARWVRRAVESTAADLTRNRKAYVKCSPLYHSVNALNIYLDRVNPRDTPEIATGDKAPRTAMLSRSRLKGTHSRLKGVPALGISKTRELPVVERPAKEIVAAPEAPEPMELPPVVNIEPMEVAETVTTTISELAKAAKDAAISRDGEKWVATQKSRRTEITVPSELMNVDIPESTQKASLPLNDEQPTETREVESTVTETASETDDIDELEVKQTPRESTIAPLNEAKDEEMIIIPGVSAADSPTVKESLGLGLESIESSTDVSTTELDESVTTEPVEAVAEEVIEPSETSTEEIPAEETETDVTIRRPIPIKSVSSPTVLEAAPSTTADIAKSDTTNSDVARSDINDEFMADDLNPQEWVRRFENNDREIAAERMAITFATGLHYGQTVADIGAGTGLFLKPFSNAVGRSGHVFAIDISPRLIEHLDARISADNISNASVVRNDGQSLELANARLDTAFLCDTYHHFQHPDEMLASIFAALKPGGQLVLLDFARIPDVSREWVLNVVRADKQTFRSEIEAAGFVYVEEVTVPGLTEHYLLRFRRPRK